MKTFILPTLIGLLTFSLNAQNFTFNPSQHIDEEIQEDNYSAHGISLMTTDLSPIHFEWSLIENTLPEGWSYSLCDLGGCYVGVPNGGVMDDITEEEALAGVTGFLKLNITASTFYGEGDISFYVFESGNPSFGDTVSMHISWTNPSSGITENGLNNVNLYPNPVLKSLNFTNLSEVDKIQIMSLTGEILIDLSPQNISEKIDVSKISEGIYLAKIIDEHGDYVSKRFVKGH
jgi:hypothetical protein